MNTTYDARSDYLHPYLDPQGSLTFAGNVTGYIRIEVYNETYLPYGYDIQPLYPLPDNPNPTTPIKVSHKHLEYEAYVPEFMSFTVNNSTEVGYSITISPQSSNAGANRPNKKLYWLGLLLAASTAFLS